MLGFRHRSYPRVADFLFFPVLFSNRISSVTPCWDGIPFHAGVQISIFCFINLTFRISTLLLNWSMTVRDLALIATHSTW